MTINYLKTKSKVQLHKSAQKNYYITVDVLIIYSFFYCLCDLQMIKLLKD